MLKKVLLGVLCGAAVLTVGILLGHYGIDKGSSVPGWVGDASRDVDESLVQDFLAEVDNNQIEGFLRVNPSKYFFLSIELTKVPHMATTAGDESTVQYTLQRWQDPESRLDRAWAEQYLVYLSFPDPKIPNKVTVVVENTTVLHIAREREKGYGPDRDDPAVVPPYAAYSPAGQAQSGSLQEHPHATSAAKPVPVNNVALLASSLIALTVGKVALGLKEVEEVAMFSGAILQLSQPLATTASRKMAWATMGHRTMWLSQTMVPERYRVGLVHGPLSSEGLFGPCFAEVVTHLQR
ncbi:hypothetical protein NHX12_028323, partial [Muraenolepis orangiensis]